MAGSEETDCITEALIREYLTKKGLAGTLETFNSEKPAVGTQRINKRSQLVKLLGLEAAAGRQKSTANQQAAITTLNMLVEHTTQKLRLQAPEPCTSSVLKVPASDCSLSSGTCSTKSDAYSLPQQQSAARDVLPVRPAVVASPCSIGADTSSPVPTKPHSAPAAGTSARMPGSATQGHSSAGQSALRSRVCTAAPFGPPPMQQTARAAAARGAAAQDDLHIEDVDDFDGDADVAGHVVAAPSTLRGSVSSSSTSGIATHGRSPPQGQQLQPEQAKQLRQLLWGGQGGPPPCWQQGLFFSSAPGLSCGLMQLQGGPCGVLAAVQGFVLAALQVQGLLGHALQSMLQQRQEALADALSDILWQARPGSFGPACVVSAAAGSRQTLQSLSYDQLNRESVVRTASSRAELGVLIRSALPQLSEPRGWGIMLLLHSLLLTRGTDTTRQDTDEADSSLVGPHGYCTNELVNLVLTGQATSNVFDGQQSLGPESLLRGVSKRSKVGSLVLHEWYRYVEVGTNLKSPLCPIWVVCSESHYSTLFVMPDDANNASAWGQGSHKLQPPLQLSYYDGLANQEGPISLAVAAAPSGGWTAKLAGVAEERGVWQGRPIPPLELVIETKWPNVHVQWQGCDPLL